MEHRLEMRVSQKEGLSRSEALALTGTAIGLMFLASAVAAWSGYIIGRAEEAYQMQKARPQVQEFEYDPMNRNRSK